MKKLLIASLTAVVAATSIPAAASDTGQVKIAISHEGLDLTKASDVAIMRQRIKTTVTDACAKAAHWDYRSACVRDGTSKAMRQLEALSRVELAYNSAAR